MTQAVYKKAASALGRIGEPVTVGALRQALADGDPATQIWAMRGLGRLEDRESVGLLLARLCSENVGVRICAAKALAKIGDSRAVAPVRSAHDEATGITRRRIGHALGELEAAD